MNMCDGSYHLADNDPNAALIELCETEYCGRGCHNGLTASIDLCGNKKRGGGRVKA